MKKVTVFMMMLVFITSAGFAKTLSDYDQNLIQCLKDDNVGIRSSAAQLLGERKVVQAVEPLINMLQNEKDFKVRIMAAIALHKIGDEKALPVLKKVARTDRNRTARRVISAIVEDLENQKLAKL